MNTLSVFLQCRFATFTEVFDLSASTTGFWYKPGSMEIDIMHSWKWIGARELILTSKQLESYEAAGCGDGDVFVAEAQQVGGLDWETASLRKCLMNNRKRSVGVERNFEWQWILCFGGAIKSW